MIEMLLKCIVLVVVLVVAGWLGLSCDAAELLLGFGTLLLALWLGFRSALKDVRKRQRRPPA